MYNILFKRGAQRMMNILKKINLPNKAIKFLIFLLAGDLFYILLHLIHKGARHFDLFTLIRENLAFALYVDLSLGESFQYLKEYWILLIFVWLIFKHKKYFFAGWALLFLYFLLDDMLSFHEGLATFVLQSFNIDPFYIIAGELRYQDYGELGVSVFFGIILISMIGIAYWRSTKEVRTIFHYLFGCLLLIAFFGVVNDFANRLFPEEGNKVIYELTRLIEDGGEMIAMSIACWYAYTLTEPEDPKSIEAS
ncbi:MAG: hypothetical protein JNK81_12775 [Anaerolineales bacterium]|nr:hypothetical protein [Anaerolineales bacterium]